MDVPIACSVLAAFPNGCSTKLISPPIGHGNKTQKEEPIRCGILGTTAFQELRKRRRHAFGLHSIETEAMLAHRHRRGRFIGVPLSRLGFQMPLRGHMIPPVHLRYSLKKPPRRNRVPLVASLSNPWSCTLLWPSEEGCGYAET